MKIELTDEDCSTIAANRDGRLVDVRQPKLEGFYVHFTYLQVHFEDERFAEKLALTILKALGRKVTVK